MSTVTMMDIAVAAGVSQPTVSRALRNHPSIPAETCQRIQKIARDLGYRPNPMVSTLMATLKTKRRSRSIGIIAYVTAHTTRDGWRFHQTFIDFYDGAAARATSLGYTLEPFWLKEPGMTSERFSRMLYTRGIQGMLISPLPRAYGHLSLDWDRFAAATIGHSVRHPDLPRAANNYYQSMLLATRQLKRRGYRRIGFFVDADTNEKLLRSWMGAFLAFQYSLPQNRRIEPCVYREHREEDKIRQWIKKNSPDAVVGPSNEALAVLKGFDLDIPGKLGFASLNTGWTRKDPAGINHHPKLTGSAAVDLIIGQLHRNERGVPDNPKLLLVPGSWVDGPTIRPPSRET